MTRPPAALERNEGAEYEAGADQRGALHQEVYHGLYRGSWLRLIMVLAARAALRPRLAFDLLGTLWTFRRRDWQRRFPFLPLPSRTYLRWRMYTAYGDEDAVPPADDVIRFARWRRRMLAP